MKMTPEMFQMLWSIIHKYALDSKNFQEKQAFKLFMKSLAENFPCETCKPHFKKMLNEIRPEDFEGKMYNGVDISYFYWTFHMHNLVNIRLGKKILSLEEAYNIHTSSACEECVLEPQNKKEGSVLKYINNHSRKSNNYSGLVSM